MLDSLLPLLIVCSALVPGTMIFFTEEDNLRFRRNLNLGANFLCLGLIGLLLRGVFSGKTYETRLPLLPDIDLVLHADELSLLFVSLSGLLWMLTTIYAIGYLEGSSNRRRFFGFFSLCVAATLGIALAGNLITFLIFYELLTLTTYPLVVHKGNAASLRAGRIYLIYTMIGGAVLLAGVAWLKSLAGALDFSVTGLLSTLPGLDPLQLKIIFVLLIAGLGVKAALVPLHGWLPIAMAAPAPVSALLHAVAVVKAGAFGIIRVVYDVYGIEFARDLGLTLGLAVVASFTIVYGSLMAIRQNDIKRRLAYSTVSQVSYIALGVAIAGPIATIGGMVHLVHQGLMKITLFFCAGNLAETLGIHKVSEINGVGRRMPFTMAAFSLAALGMIGLPPTAGFVSKWYLGVGALEVEAYWVLGILVLSTLLNAIYFLPLLYAAWFKEPVRVWAPKQTLETPWKLLLPPVITALLSIAVGVFANLSMSPLSWAELIAGREYNYDLVRPMLTDLSLPWFAWAVVIPLLATLAVLLPLSRRTTQRIMPWMALPALGVALFAPAEQVAIPGLFFGGVIGLDPFSRVMLLLAALLWLLVGLFNRDYPKLGAHRDRYALFFLLCMVGSFGLTLSFDLFGFIAFYTLMGVAAYGLVVHTGTPAALQAGRTYMQWVIVGEVLLFSALLGIEIGSDSGAPQPEWVSWLLLTGFGIKAGLLGLHFWLPRAHPVAPVPASALLSGLMVKAGILGWCRFLPLGEMALPEMGQLMIGLGIAGALLSCLVGFLQHNPKTLLAYSTVSQMGILSAVVGAGLLQPEGWPLLSTALLLYVVHHGLAKSALFLSVGISAWLSVHSPLRWLIWWVVLISAAALVGLPMTSGALAKVAVKSSLVDLDGLITWLSVAAVGTTLLMLRLLAMLYAESLQTRGEIVVASGRFWSLLGLGLLVSGLAYGLSQADPFRAQAFTLSAVWGGLWPALLGGAIFWVIRSLPQRLSPIPAGDLLVLGEWVMTHATRLFVTLWTGWVDGYRVSFRNHWPQGVSIDKSGATRKLSSVEPSLTLIGVLLMIAVALMVALLHA